MLNKEIVRELLNYNAETGAFTWKVKISRPIIVGSVAGCYNPDGYRCTKIYKKSYLMHRLAWLYFYGEWPAGEIDHINHIRSDNRISNLRVVTRTENTKNTSRQRRSVSGVTGVSWNKQGKKWVAYIGSNKKTHSLGSFFYFLDAVKARKEAEVKYNFHSNHGEECHEDYRLRLRNL